MCRDAAGVVQAGLMPFADGISGSGVGRSFAQVPPRLPLTMFLSWSTDVL